MITNKYIKPIAWHIHPSAETEFDKYLPLSNQVCSGYGWTLLHIENVNYYADNMFKLWYNEELN